MAIPIKLKYINSECNDKSLQITGWWDGKDSYLRLVDGKGNIFLFRDKELIKFGKRIVKEFAKK